MRRGTFGTLLILCTSTLAACGDTVGKQSLYGAAGGAVLADAFGGDWRLGALAGAATNVLACDNAAKPCN